MKPWQNKEWCIPAKENAEFVCAMEDVLAVYKRSYDETHPLICMDESSKQHIKETRQPIPAKPGAVEKYDTEYERNGVSNMFMFFEPIAGKRHVVVTDQSQVGYAPRTFLEIDGDRNALKMLRGADPTELP